MTEFDLEIDSVDRTGGFGGASWPLDPTIVFHSTARFGKVEARVDNTWYDMAQVLDFQAKHYGVNYTVMPTSQTGVPLTSIRIRYTPFKDAAMLVQMCNTEDSFVVTARTLRVDAPITVRYRLELPACTAVFT